MKPGPELDALVAEHVMGWQWNIRNSICYRDNFNAPDCWPNFQPSTDIGAAWQVVEKICTNDISDPPSGMSLLDFELRRSEDGCWNAQFGPHQSGYIANTAPLAVCLAALKAVGVEIPNKD